MSGNSKSRLAARDKQLSSLVFGDVEQDDDSDLNNRFDDQVCFIPTPKLSIVFI
jgi:hypothetical protein